MTKDESRKEFLYIHEPIINNLKSLTNENLIKIFIIQLKSRGYSIEETKQAIQKIYDEEKDFFKNYSFK